MIHFLLALLSILSRQKCLTDIGTKGAARAHSGKRLLALYLAPKKEPAIRECLLADLVKFGYMLNFIQYI
jgi:hypothetical protein